MNHTAVIRTIVRAQDSRASELSARSTSPVGGSCHRRGLAPRAAPFLAPAPPPDLPVPTTGGTSVTARCPWVRGRQHQFGRLRSTASAMICWASIGRATCSQLAPSHLKIGVLGLPSDQSIHEPATQTTSISSPTPPGVISGRVEGRVNLAALRAEDIENASRSTQIHRCRSSACARRSFSAFLRKPASAMPVTSSWLVCPDSESA